MNSKNAILSSIIAIGLVVIGVVLGLSYPFDNGQIPGTNECLAPGEAIVTKVLDGDTIVVEGGSHIRLLGIDTDEKGGDCYEEAKLFLEDLILGEKVGLERDISDVDMYGRCLRYIFKDGKNINVQMVESGMAIARFYEPDVHYRAEIVEAEQIAKDNRAGCKWKNLEE